MWKMFRKWLGRGDRRNRGSKQDQQIQQVQQKEQTQQVQQSRQNWGTQQTEQGQQTQQNQQSQTIYGQKYDKIKLSRNMQDNLANIKNAMNNNFDIKTKEFKLSGQDIRAAVVYISNLVNEDLILQHIVNPLMLQSSLILDKNETILFNTIKDSMVTAEYTKEVESLDEIIFSVMSGDTFLCIQGYQKGFIIGSRGYVGRQVGEPILEPSVKGSQEGFAEILRSNMGLIRRRIRDPNLVFEIYKIGRRTQMELVIAYLKDVADQDIVDQATHRITSIDVDGIVCTAQLGQYITDNPNSIFPLYQITERPDRVVRALMEGRVAILMEGGADVLLVPVTMPILLHSADDYYENWVAASVMRLTRYVGMFVSAFLPAIYIALAGHHPGMLPTQLVLTIAGARAGVPFPGVLEAILMEGTLEILQEASIRLPRVVGQSVSIVGGLVIGQAAVQAGLVGPIMIIIIGLTAIGSFTVTDYSLGLATRLIRIPFIVLATTLGGFGVSMGMLVLLIYVANLESFGIRYIRPLSPYRSKDLKDTFIRMKEVSKTERPSFLFSSNEQRQSNSKRGK